jgi:hypothetical protein
MPTINEEDAHHVGPPLDSVEHIELIAIEAAVRDASNIEEWYCDQLLTEVTSLGEFYRRQTSERRSP